MSDAEDSNLFPRSYPATVSVVIPVRNGADLLPVQLEALTRQRYEHDWEVIVVDNGSTDDSGGVARSWADRLPVRVVPANDKPGVNYARNVGVRSARGELIVFCDADDEVSDGWLRAIVETSLESDAVGGSLDSAKFHDPDVVPLRAVKLTDYLIYAEGFLLFAGGGNLSVWSDVLHSLNGFNEQYRYGGTDVEFSWRLQLSGFRLDFSKDALVHIRTRDTARSLARQFYLYGKANPQLYLDFRSAGMPRNSLQRIIRNWAWIVLHSPDLLRGRSRRGNWIRRTSLASGNVAGSVQHHTIYL